MTPQRRAASASPDEIHKSNFCSWEEGEGKKSSFNRSKAFLVNIHLEISDDANIHAGGLVAGVERTVYPGGGNDIVLFLIRPEKNRPGVRVQSSGILEKSMVSRRAS